MEPEGPVCSGGAMTIHSLMIFQWCFLANFTLGLFCFIKCEYFSGKEQFFVCVCMSSVLVNVFNPSRSTIEAGGLPFFTYQA